MSKKEFTEVVRAFACWLFVITAINLIAVSITFAVEVIKGMSGIDTTKIVYFLMGIITSKILRSLINE